MTDVFVGQLGIKLFEKWANVILLPGLLLVVVAVMAAVWGQPGWCGLAAVTDRVDDAAASFSCPL